jgi:hypothetical protein
MILILTPSHNRDSSNLWFATFRPLEMEALSTPQALHPFTIHLTPVTKQHHMNTPVAVTRIFNY